MILFIHRMWYGPWNYCFHVILLHILKIYYIIKAQCHFDSGQILQILPFSFSGVFSILCILHPCYEAIYTTLNFWTGNNAQYNFNGVLDLLRDKVEEHSNGICFKIRLSLDSSFVKRQAQKLQTSNPRLLTFNLCSTWKLSSRKHCRQQGLP